MFRHILVPLDGSLRAEGAIPIAARIARACAGTLIFVRVIQDVPEDAGAIPESALLFKELLQAKKEEAQRYLTHIASSPQVAGLPAILSMPQGPVARAIQATAEAYQADLLVCSEQPVHQHPYSTAGSLVEQLGWHLAIPLLLLPAQEPLHGFQAHAQQPLTCLIVSPGPQPEHLLIAPAVSLLTALPGRKQGHLHFASLPGALPRLAPTKAIQRVAAASHRSRDTVRQSRVLLQETPVEKKQVATHEPDPQTVIVLDMSLLKQRHDAIREMSAYPRLFVPSSQKKQEHSQA
jgi:nucleotide-binding universal stress UspA family protein